jgi:hypothetical protein
VLLPPQTLSLFAFVAHSFVAGVTYVFAPLALFLSLFPRLCFFCSFLNSAVA